MVSPIQVRAAVSIAAISAALWGLAGDARAQNADAEALFNDAVKLEAAGKTDEACDAFEGSNRLEPRAGTLLRLGQCREKQGRLVSAWSAYKDSLTRVKDPKKKQAAVDRIAALEPKLSYLTVSVPDDVRVDGLVVLRNGKPLDPVLWNRAVPVDGGAYTIEGSAPGHEGWRTTVEVAVSGDKLSVEVPRFKAIEKLVDPPPGGGGGDEIAPPPDDDGPSDDDRPAPSSFTGKRKLALGLAGAGVVAIGAGVALGLSAKGLEDDAFALCPDGEGTPCANAAEANALSDRGDSRAMLANVAFGVGGVAIVGAAVLWFTGKPAARDGVAVTPRIGPRSAGVTVQLRF
jgi:serine/threonine-protein kinase